jgi:hypothetical protein
MARSGALVIVQTFPQLHGSRAKIVSRGIEDLLQYYALRDAQWCLEYAREPKGPQPPIPVRTIYQGLTTRIPSKSIATSYSNLLRGSGGNFEEYWKVVLRHRMSRNYMITATELEVSEHVAIVCELLCSIQSNHLAQQHSGIYGGEAVVFTDFTIERHHQDPRRNPYHVIPLLRP